jgi:hypothetical protein
VVVVVANGMNRDDNPLYKRAIVGNKQAVGLLLVTVQESPYIFPPLTRSGWSRLCQRMSWCVTLPAGLM